MKKGRAYRNGKSCPLFSSIVCYGRKDLIEIEEIFSWSFFPCTSIMEKPCAVALIVVIDGIRVSGKLNHSVLIDFS